MARRRLHKRYRKNPDDSPSSSPGQGPPVASEVAEYIIPGFGGFAATRLLTRIAATQVANLKPDMGKHAGAAASLAAFFAAWFLAHRVKWLAKYQEPLVIGAGLAAVQSLLQLYFPKLGWIVSDASPEIASASTAAASSAQPLLTAPNGAQFRAQDVRPVNFDPSEFTYDDSFDAGRMSRDTSPSDGDLLADMEVDDSAPQAAGIFGGN